jgi:hypothetical protein
MNDNAFAEEEFRLDRRDDVSEADCSLAGSSGSLSP